MFTVVIAIAIQSDATKFPLDCMVFRQLAFTFDFNHLIVKTV